MFSKFMGALCSILKWNLQIFAINRILSIHLDKSLEWIFDLNRYVQNRSGGSGMPKIVGWKKLTFCRKKRDERCLWLYKVSIAAWMKQMIGRIVCSGDTCTRWSAPSSFQILVFLSLCLMKFYHLFPDLSLSISLSVTKYFLSLSSALPLSLASSGPHPAWVFRTLANWAKANWLNPQTICWSLAMLLLLRRELLNGYNSGRNTNGPRQQAGRKMSELGNFLGGFCLNLVLTLYLSCHRRPILLLVSQMQYSFANLRELSWLTEVSFSHCFLQVAFCISLQFTEVLGAEHKVINNFTIKKCIWIHWYFMTSAIVVTCFKFTSFNYVYRSHNVFYYNFHKNGALVNL